MESKGVWYKTLLLRADDAIQNGYYLEAIFIFYAIIDDRTESILKHLSIRGPHNAGPRLDLIQNINDEDVKFRLNNRINPETQATEPLKVIDDTQTWCKQFRNILQHNLADPKSYINKSGGAVLPSDEWEAIAREGREVTRKLNAAVMRLKK